MFDFENKSVALIISTILSYLIGVALIAYDIYIIKFIPSMRDPASAILLWMPTFGMLLVIFIVFVIAAFELLTAVISLKSNKLIWLILHIIVLIIACFAGLLFSELTKFNLSSLFSGWAFIGIVLRIVGYFNQKKINRTGETLSIESTNKE